MVGLTSGGLRRIHLLKFVIINVGSFFTFVKNETRNNTLSLLIKKTTFLTIGKLFLLYFGPKNVICVSELFLSYLIQRYSSKRWQYRNFQNKSQFFNGVRGWVCKRTTMFRLYFLLVTLSIKLRVDFNGLTITFGTYTYHALKSWLQGFLTLTISTVGKVLDLFFHDLQIVWHPHLLLIPF